MSEAKAPVSDPSAQQHQPPPPLLHPLSQPTRCEPPVPLHQAHHPHQPHPQPTTCVPPLPPPHAHNHAPAPHHPH
ncbi:Protein of unknown function [Gryllus bimaculatus]|nr:Protein of unknown function [Gryllus bimaculatus]